MTTLQELWNSLKLTRLSLALLALLHYPRHAHTILTVLPVHCGKLSHCTESCQLLHNCMKRPAIRERLWRKLELLLFDRPYIKFLLVVCSSNVSILHHFQAFTTCIVHMTACNLEKSFNFNQTVKIISHMHFWFVYKHTQCFKKRKTPNSWP